MIVVEKSAFLARHLRHLVQLDFFTPDHAIKRSFETYILAPLPDLLRSDVRAEPRLEGFCPRYRRLSPAGLPLAGHTKKIRQSKQSDLRESLDRYGSWRGRRG